VEINLGDVNYRPRGVDRQRRGLGSMGYREAWSFGRDISGNCGFFHKKSTPFTPLAQFLKEKVQPGRCFKHNKKTPNHEDR
jgi:hypothetical protein